VKKIIREWNRAEENSQMYGTSPSNTWAAIEQLRVAGRDLVVEVHDLEGTIRILKRERVPFTEEIKRLKESGECHVARPSNGMLVCRRDSPCLACRVRHLEASRVRLLELLNDEKALTQHIGRHDPGCSICHPRERAKEMTDEMFEEVEASLHTGDIDEGLMG
jgi:hypothetical protein